MEYVDSLDELAYETTIQNQSLKIAEMSILLEDAEFMIRKISNHPKHAEYMVDSLRRVSAEIREILAKGAKCTN